MLKAVPYTQGRYVVNVASGQVIDTSLDQVLYPESTPEGLVYKNLLGISVWFKDGVVPIGMLVLLAHTPPTIPPEELKHLTVKYSDGNMYNASYTNLYWDFVNGPIESKVYPGFYYVPEYKWLLVSKDAKVLSYAPPAPVRFKQQSESANDYLEISAIATSGKARSVRVHTVVALALATRPGDISNLVVNHIDLNILNNNADNLEWVSNSINLMHPTIMQGADGVMRVVHEKNGVLTHYTNLEKMSKDVGIPATALWRAIRHQTPLPDGSRVRTIVDCDLTDKSLRNSADFRSFSSSLIRLLVKTVATGEISAFQSQNAAAAHMGVTPSAIIYHLSQNRAKLLIGKYLIIREGEEWPAQEEMDGVRRGSGKKTVVVTNELTGEVKEYESATLAIRELGLSKKVVTVSLKIGDNRLIKNYRFKYKTDDYQSRF